MKTRSCVIVGLMFVAFAASLVRADTFTPSHSCSKPYKPYQFTSKWEVENFNDDVRQYRSCIEEFVEEQQDAIKRHRNAVNEVIEEWNSFVRYELR